MPSVGEEALDQRARARCRRRMRRADPLRHLELRWRRVPRRAGGRGLGRLRAARLRLRAGGRRGRARGAPARWSGSRDATATRPGAAPARPPRRRPRRVGGLERRSVRRRDPRRRGVGPGRAGHEGQRRGDARGRPQPGPRGDRPRRATSCSRSSPTRRTAGTSGPGTSSASVPICCEGVSHAIGEGGGMLHRLPDGSHLYPVACGERGHRLDRAHRPRHCRARLAATQPTTRSRCSPGRSRGWRRSAGRSA